MPGAHALSSTARYVVLFGPEGFADRVPGLPGPPVVERRAAGGPESLLRDLASDALALVVVHHDSAAILAALRPGPAAGTECVPESGPRPAPILVVGCPDAAAVGAALAAGADLALRADACADEVAAISKAALDLRDLSRMVLKDDLTAAWNRRYFDECLTAGLDRARVENKPLSLIFMDIDNLKAVNLKHGHSTGSHVLREVAMRLIRTVRGSDAVMRYGGDEFCVVLPGLALADAMEVAERLRESIASEAFDVPAGGTVALTASFGIATWPDHAADARSLVAAADEAMLSIKDRQKNGIHVAGAA